MMGKKIVGWLAAGYVGLIALLDWFGRIDIILSRVSPGWEAEALKLLLQPPGWATLLILFGGLWLIYRSVRPQPIPAVPELSISHLPPTDDAEAEFEKGFHRAAMLNGSRNDAKLLLAQLRAEGVSIRNHPQSVDHMFAKDLDDWLARITKWMEEVIEAIATFDAADAEWFKTLGEVPAPRIGTPNIRLEGSNDRDRYIKAFREHDYRLAQLDRLFVKYGIGG